MALLLKNAHVIDPQVGINEVCEILIRDGKIVEVGVPERAGGEKRRRFSAKKTVENARARLGEGGYNVLHNNCEHFVWECAFGIHRSTAEDEAQARWRKLLSDKGRESGSAK